MKHDTPLPARGNEHPPSEGMSVSYAPDAAFFASTIEVERPRETFNPLSTLPPALTKDLFRLWGQTRHGNFCAAAVARLAKHPESLKTLEAAGLLPAYFCYSLENAFNQGAKP